MAIKVDATIIDNYFNEDEKDKKRLSLKKSLTKEEIDLLKNLAKRFYELIKDKYSDFADDENIKQNYVAEKIKISESTVSDFLCAKKRPRITTFDKIRKHFNVSADYLMGISGVKSIDIELQAISKKLGLNDKAINKLEEYNAEPFKRYIINHFFTSLYNSGAQTFSDVYINIIMQNVCYKAKLKALYGDSENSGNSNNDILNGQSKAQDLMTNTDGINLLTEFNKFISDDKRGAEFIQGHIAKEYTRKDLLIDFIKQISPYKDDVNGLENEPKEFILKEIMRAIFTTEEIKGLLSLESKAFDENGNFNYTKAGYERMIAIANKTYEIPTVEQKE